MLLWSFLFQVSYINAPGLFVCFALSFFPKAVAEAPLKSQRSAALLYAYSIPDHQRNIKHPAVHAELGW